VGGRKKGGGKMINSKKKGKRGELELVGWKERKK